MGLGPRQATERTCQNLQEGNCIHMDELSSPQWPHKVSLPRQGRGQLCWGKLTGRGRKLPYSVLIILYLCPGTLLSRDPTRPVAALRKGEKSEGKWKGFLPRYQVCNAFWSVQLGVKRQKNVPVSKAQWNRGGKEWGKKGDFECDN